jgi:FdrA protein
VVACLLGGDNSGRESAGMTLVGTLEEAAFAAMGQSVPELDISDALRESVKALAPTRKYLRGLYSGGTLCYETLFILKDHIDVESNVALRKDLKLDYPAKGKAHCCVDLGEDEFTQGRPHPIIDLGLRLERLAEDMADPEVRVILLDLVLGFGAHPNPAAQLSEAIHENRQGLADGGPVFIAHVCGTDADPQILNEQENTLRQKGVFLYPTNAQAARAALAVIRGDV